MIFTPVGEKMRRISKRREKMGEGREEYQSKYIIGSPFPSSPTRWAVVPSSSSSAVGSAIIYLLFFFGE